MMTLPVCIPRTKTQRDGPLELAQSILERIESNRLTQVPLFHLDE